MRKRVVRMAVIISGLVVLWAGGAASQESHPVATETNSMAFPDQPEFRVLPRTGAAAVVECAVYPPRSPGHKAGLIIHLYGSGGSSRTFNMMRAPYTEVRRLLWERGYWLVVPNLGGSHWMNDAAATSLDGVIEGMIQNHGVDPARVHILGTSMGAGSGLVYVMRRPHRIRSICAVFPMTDFAQWVQESPGYLARIAKAHKVEPLDVAPVLDDLSPLRHRAAFAGIPVLLLHGDADTIVPVHHSRDFAAALRAQGSPVTYHEVRGAKHNDAIAGPYQGEIVEFFTRADLEVPSAQKPGTPVP